MRHKNGFLTFCFSFVPGCGQMYLGYMKRGVSLLFWFFAFIGIATMLNIGVISVLAVVIWAYSFFDTFNIRNLSEYQRSGFNDEYLPNPQWVREYGFDRLLQSSNAKRWLGRGLVVLGIVILWNNVLYSVLYPLYNYMPVLYNLINRLPTIAIALAVVWLGVRMIRGTSNADKDDTVPFGSSRGGWKRQSTAEDYMHPSNTPPAPWAHSPTPEPEQPYATPAPPPFATNAAQYSTPPMAPQSPVQAPQPVQAPPMPEVDSTIVLQTVTGEEFLGTNETEAIETLETTETESVQEADATPEVVETEQAADTAEPAAENSAADADAPNKKEE